MCVELAEVDGCLWRMTKDGNGLVVEEETKFLVAQIAIWISHRLLFVLCKMRSVLIQRLRSQVKPTQQVNIYTDGFRNEALIYNELL